MVVFNKQDDNANEIADRKFLKEKYNNIVGFYNVSCKTEFGLSDFKKHLENNITKLRTVDEQFPNNWFNIKKLIEEQTSGEQHYLNYEIYSSICDRNNVNDDKTQKLLLKYFTTIGAITWFGDTYLSLLHVLSPAWITQGVYKIVTSKKTSTLYGHIKTEDFKELLQPVDANDYVYDNSHYGYILGMMKKFDLCYTPDDKNLLLPSAFGKAPQLEYSEFKGTDVRVYILQFKDYMPIALMHRFTAKRLSDTYENNYWYSGIVIKDTKSTSIAMIHADKEAKRIYIRIKGESKLGLWEHIRREFYDITSSYANMSYNELLLLDEQTNSIVNYEDLISYIRANKRIYFHPKLGRDFNVGYLASLFETKEETIGKFKERTNEEEQDEKMSVVVNILNNNSPNVNARIDNNINIDIQIINNIGNNIKGDANYLLEELGSSNKSLSENLKKIIQFADDAKATQNSGDMKAKGWARKLKSITQALSNSGEQLKHIQDGGEALSSLLKGVRELSNNLHFDDVKAFFDVIAN